MIENMKKPTQDDYFSTEMGMLYWSASQVKSMMSCQAMTYAEMTGNYEREKGSALMVGSYVDAYVESKESFRAFCEKYEKEIYKKDGSPKADYLRADEMIDRIEQDPTFMAFLQGDHQKIVTGTIADVPFKAKLDVYFPHNRIVDLKTTKDMKPMYAPGEGKVSFVEYWHWDMQMAIYQELIRQETGERLPCYLAVVTKEDPPDIEIIEIPQEVMDADMEILKEKLPMYDAIKSGLIEPERCGSCAYCRKTKKLFGAKPLTFFTEE